MSAVERVDVAAYTVPIDGAPEPRDGVLRSDLAAPGPGLELKRRDAEPYAA